MKIGMTKAKVKQLRKWNSGVLLAIPHYDPFEDMGDCWFDTAAANDILEFFPGMLRHLEGPKAGEPFKLAKWERAILANLFGWKRPDGLRRFREAFIEVPRKNGKMLDLNTPIPTSVGWTSMGEIQYSDILFDDNGLPCNVTWIGPIEESPESYLICFSNGESVRACGEHLWTTQARVDKPGNRRSGRTKRPLVRERTTKELYETQLYGKRRDRNHSLLMPEALQLSTVSLPINPYFLGCWLGDGTSTCCRLTCSDEDISHYISEFNCCNYYVSTKKHINRAPTLLIQNTNKDIFGSVKVVGKKSKDNLQKILREIGVFNNKHIPQRYLRASYSDRLALLQGLMDTDGTASKNGRVLEYTTTSRLLADNVSELLATMGIKFSSRQGIAKLNGLATGLKWRIQFSVNSDDIQVFRLPRKRKRLEQKPITRVKSRAKTVQIKSINKCDSVPMRCIAVDSPSHQYRFGKTMLPTHNTSLIAGVVIYGLLPEGDGETRAQIYSAAGDREQAKLVFAAVKGQCEESPELDKRTQTYQNSIVAKDPETGLDTGSFYKAISAEAKTKHGYNSHIVVVDELHTQPNDELVDVLETSMGSRAQPLLIHITTSDYDKPSICNEKETYAYRVRGKDQYGKKIAKADDNSFLPAIWQATIKDDWRKPSVWRKANPCLGNSLSEEYIRRKCQKAIETPRFLNTFLRLHLNVKTSTDVVWIDLNEWDKCCGPVIEEELIGKRCFTGFDLGHNTDTTSMAHVFPPDMDCALYRVLLRVYIPEENAKQRELKDHVPYLQWAREGFIRLTPGNVIDYAKIKSDFEGDYQRFDIQEVAFDRWGFEMLKQTLIIEGVSADKFVSFGQGFVSLSAPSKELEKLIKGQELCHGGNPVFRWMAGNVVLETDAAENIKPNKKKSTERIDGMVAVIMALGRAITIAEPKKSIYEDRDMRTL